MSISAVGPSAVRNDNDGDDKAGKFGQVKQAFNSLSTALQSGNLADAQKAYATLQSLKPPQANGQSGASKDPNAANFDALGKALQSGNLADAQTAFASIQSSHKGHHHHSGGASSSSDASTTSSSSTSGGFSGTLSITA